MLADGGATVFLGQQYLQSMAAMIFGEMGAVMALSERFAYLSGKVSRVAELQVRMRLLACACIRICGSVLARHRCPCVRDILLAWHDVAIMQEVMDELDAAQPEGRRVGDALSTPMPFVDGRLRNSYKPWKQCMVSHPSNVHGQYLPLALPAEQLTQARGEGKEIRLAGVDLVTPRGEAIATDVSCCVTEEAPLMVTGRNATGKTSLVRVISGLWPHTQGTLTVRAMACLST